jgi:DNA/RNA-binding domain of Phe-tRNA-synthetase-like protein
MQPGNNIICSYERLFPLVIELELPDFVEKIIYPQWFESLLFDKNVFLFAPHTDVSSVIRDLLRLKGFKPSGRNKPSSEYLKKLYDEKQLPKINPVIDLGNVISAYSGIPLSIIDLDKVTPSCRISAAGPDESYVFNSSGQQITLGGLPCLYDQRGPCANPVKDAQRTKLSGQSRHVLLIMWSEISLEDYTFGVWKCFESFLEKLHIALGLVHVVMDRIP